MAPHLVGLYGELTPHIRGFACSDLLICEIRDDFIFSQKDASFCENESVIKMNQSMETKIKNRITEHGNGWCFTPMHFSDYISN